MRNENLAVVTLSLSSPSDSFLPEKSLVTDELLGLMGIDMPATSSVSLGARRYL
jgi:hypothetical protein